MGNRRTKHPAIASPTNENLLEVVESIKESLEIGRTDLRGDPLDQWATLRDLNKLGLTTIADQSSISAGGPGPQLADPGNILPLPPLGDGGFLIPIDPNASRPLPGRPVNVRTVSLWDSIMIKWDWPDDGPTVDWKGSIIWMSTTPNFADGSFLGYGSVNFYIHEDIGLSGGSQYSTRYYWVAWWGNEVATNGIGNPHNIPGIGNQTDWSPYSYQPGVPGTTAVNPDYVLRVLENQVTESQIYSSLNKRIDLVDYDSEGNRYTEHVQDRILSASFGANGQIYAAIAETASTRVKGNEVSGEYVIRLDLDGYITGFGLSAMAYIDEEGNQYGQTSQFLVRVDNFAVGFPAALSGGVWGDDQVEFPFVVGGVDGIATVGINGQLVVDGTIYANSIHAHTIGAKEINAESIWAGLVTAERVIATTFRTREKPAVRLELNGVGTEGELYPLWYGWGNTTGANSHNSTPAFYFTNTGDMVLAGELRVTGAGKFYIGRNDAGEYRVELGGWENDTIMWVGTGPVDTSETNQNWLLYIDKAGNAKFRGTVEAKYVSGEISRTGIFPTSDSGDPNYGKGNSYVTAPSLNVQSTAAIPESSWVVVDVYELPKSVFGPHLPVFHVDMLLYGTGVTIGAVRLSWRPSNENTYREILRTPVNLTHYGGYHSFSANANAKVTGVAYFKLEIAGLDGGEWSGNGPLETSRQIGYVYGIR